MQAVIDWVMSHLWLVLIVSYELWSLVPESVVKSSSILTWLGELLKSLKDKNPPPKV